VSTPGINAPGHLFRGDGGIVLALKPFATTTLPSVADIAQRLLVLLEQKP
jgi:formylmethanofuran dehydrogenase subunit B